MGEVVWVALAALVGYLCFVYWKSALLILAILFVLFIVIFFFWWIVGIIIFLISPIAGAIFFGFMFLVMLRRG